MQDSRKFGELEACEEIPLPLFESCANIIAMMALKMLVAFLPLMGNLGCYANPNGLKQRQSARCACQLELLRDSLTDSSEY